MLISSLDCSCQGEIVDRMTRALVPTPLPGYIMCVSVNAAKQLVRSKAYLRACADRESFVFVVVAGGAAVVQVACALVPPRHQETDAIRPAHAAGALGCLLALVCQLSDKPPCRHR